MRHVIAGLVLLISFSGSVLANTPKILKISEIKPGIEAIGYSVFKGVEPQRFDVILGEPVNILGSYYILARISGGPMDTPLERIGPAAGMSGSPIFVGCINKELSDKEQYDNCISSGVFVGALSASMSGFIEGGMNSLLTPAERMLGTEFNGYVAVDSFLRRMSPNPIFKSTNIKNLMLFSSLDSGDKSLPQCSEFANSEIKAGSMVSVYLAKGSMPIAASGTVTWRDDDRIYIFGHPLFGTGMVNYPFSQISIADTLQTPLQPEKIPGCELEQSGAMLVDGAYEVAGIVGMASPTFPFSINLYVGNQMTSFQEEVVPNSPLTRSLLRQLPLIWASQVAGDFRDLSIAYRTRVVFANEPELFWKNVAPAHINFDNEGNETPPLVEVLSRLDKALSAVDNSGFKHNLRYINLDVQLGGTKVWKKKDIFLSKTKASPGDIIFLHIVLEDFYGQGEVKHLSLPIKIPKDFLNRLTEDQSPQISLLVQDGAHFTDKTDSSPKASTSLDGLMTKINQAMNHQMNVLYVQQTQPKVKEDKESDNFTDSLLNKPTKQWESIQGDDLEQVIQTTNTETLLLTAPPLDGYINFNPAVILTVNVEPPQNPKVRTQSKLEPKKKHKWFLLF